MTPWSLCHCAPGSALARSADPEGRSSPSLCTRPPSTRTPSCLQLMAAVHYDWDAENFEHPLRIGLLHLSLPAACQASMWFNTYRRSK